MNDAFVEEGWTFAEIYKERLPVNPFSIVIHHVSHLHVQDSLESAQSVGHAQNS